MPDIKWNNKEERRCLLMNTVIYTEDLLNRNADVDSKLIDECIETLESLDSVYGGEAASYFPISWR
jgi:hypothetical protein